VASRYEAGFAACVAEVGRYLTSVDVDVVPRLSAVLPHLVNHLAGCLQRRHSRDSVYATTPNTPVPVMTDESSAEHYQGHETYHDYHRHEPVRRRQSSDDLNYSFVQASYLTVGRFAVYRAV